MMNAHRPALCCRVASLDPVRNLATEETLLSQVQPGQFLVFFYVNRPSIVIGRYQNPWLECRVDQLEHRGIGLYRRISGGGTVYHDPGNLNFSFIMDRQFYDQKKLFSLIIAALDSVGIAARIEQKSNIVTGSRKISGNAFCLKKDRAMHHGTVLLNANMDALHGVLKPAHPGIVSKGIQSNPVPVVNLKEIVPDLNRFRLEQAVCRVLEREFGSVQTIPPPRPEPALMEKYTTWDWTFGESPAFSIEMAGGGRVQVEKGIITRVDGMPTGRVWHDLRGQRLTIELFREQFLHSGIK